jgi:ADP-ribosyl-[dinitrogen reductase] hydrolase
MIRTSETHRHGSTPSTRVQGAAQLASPSHRASRIATFGGPWARDLTEDLDAIAAWNAKSVVTLIEPHEFLLLAISDLGAEVQRRGMEWLHLPIRDVGTPGPKFEEQWPAHSKRLRQRLDEGENIVVHCRGGLGRAGMISARLVVKSGVEPNAAIERVRAARPGAIETPQQEEWVRSGWPRSLTASS